MDLTLIKTLEDFVRAGDVNKLPPAERETVVKFELESIAFFNDFATWIASREPSFNPSENTTEFRVFLSMIAHLVKMSEYVITDEVLKVNSNTHIRNHDKYKTCYFCKCEVSDNKASQRYKMVYSKKTKVKTEAFFIVCYDCLRYVKSMHNLRSVIKSLQRVAPEDVGDWVAALEVDKQRVTAVLDRLKAMDPTKNQQ
jgi:hypothetical protein